MPYCICAFILGVLTLQQQARLPDLLCLLSGVVIVLLLLGFNLAFGKQVVRRYRWFGCLLAAVLAGFVWAGIRAQIRMERFFPVSQVKENIVLRGTVAELLDFTEHAVRFIFIVDKDVLSERFPDKLLLRWYAPRVKANTVMHDVWPPPISAGQRWQLTVRLKPPRGNHNNGTFDYESWLLQKNIRASGYVRSAASNILLAPHAFLDASPQVSLQVIRQFFKNRLLQNYHDTDKIAWLLALAMGDRSAMTTRQWDVLRATGTAHLFSISGLHISLVAVFFGGFVGLLWRLLPRALLWVPAQKMAAGSGWLGALFYAALAGFSLPTQRAFIMLSIFVVSIFAARTLWGIRTIAWAAFAVVLLDPWSVLSAGFWLSFGAVLSLFILLRGRQYSESRLVTTLRVQLGIAVLLLPVTLLFFQQFSLISPLANLIAIPWVSLVCVPLVLAVLVLNHPLILTAAQWALDTLYQMLVFLAEFDFAAATLSPLPPVLLGVVLLATVILCLPRGTPGRWLGLLGILPLWWWSPPRPPIGDFTATVLDVGNGLAVHLQTASHDLLYDSGPRYSAQADAGQRVVVPYLMTKGVRTLDMMLISHDDSDHTGGFASVLQHFDIGALIAGVDMAHPMLRSAEPAGLVCHQGMQWRWDGVTFAILHPSRAAEVFASDNERSCVLRVENQAGATLLLTGDITARIERQIITDPHNNGWLKSDVVIAPHHGSATSSSRAFIAHTQPDAVIFSAGYLNHFKHPRKVVIQRWQQYDAKIFRTDQQGAITLEFIGNKVKTSSWQQHYQRYWHIPAPKSP